MSGRLDGRRLLVVGASSGIGRAVGVAAAAEGARVGLAARRRDRLEDAVAECGGAVSLPCDVRDAAACHDVVERAREALGGLDSLVYAAGTSPLRPLVDSDADVWRLVLETNLVGAALVTRAALPHLERAGGRAAYLSTIAVGRPWPGLVAYTASKAALEETVRGWRLEHPAITFTTVAVGPTVTGMADDWDPAAATGAFARWQSEGYLTSPHTMAPDEVAAAAIDVLTAPVRLEHVRLMPD